MLFMNFHTKSTTFYETQKNQVNMCVYMYHLHIHAPHVPPNTTKKYKIYLAGLPSVLYERSGQNESCIESAVFVAFQMFSVLFTYFS